MRGWDLYLARMCSRTTPFGLFAGTTRIPILDVSTAVQFSKERYYFKDQVNLFAVMDIIKKLDNSADASKLTYRPNNTIYILGNKIFYIEQFNKDGFPATNLSSISHNKFTATAIEAARESLTIDQLISCLPQSDDISLARKRNFIVNLIQEQVLVNTLWPTVATVDFVADLIKKADLMSIQSESLDSLKAIHPSIEKKVRFNEREVNHKNMSFITFRDALDKNSIKTDTFFDLTETSALNQRVVEEIIETSKELNILNEASRSTNEMQQFVRKFQERYDTKFVPLLQAIDPNFGVGFGATSTGSAEYLPLLESIPLMSSREASVGGVYETNQDRILDKVFRKFLETGETIIKIDDEVKLLLEGSISKVSKPINNSQFCFGSVLSQSAVEVDKLNYKFAPVLCHAPYATRLTNRFASESEEFKDLIAEIGLDEQNLIPDKILAEVVTIPDDKYANIALCSPIRNYEIPYISVASLSHDHVIGIDDLLVGVLNGKVTIRSKRLRKDIIPALSNAYNISKATPFVRFLAEVAHQDVEYGYNWLWGRHNGESHLPRIEYKKFILARERWFITRKKVNKEFTDLNEEFNNIRVNLKMPKMVILAEGDNELLLDLDNKYCLKILFKTLSKRNVTLFEYLHQPSNCFIKDEKGSYANSFLFMIGQKAMNTSQDHFQPSNKDNPQIQRVFAPGSEWLYLKIYGGSILLEEVLTETIAPFASKLLSDKIIDQWFFIRYQDPDFHLRVRFHISTKTEIGYQILTNLYEELERLIENQSIKIQLDTYVREIERYGVENILLSEDIFFYDSQATVNFLNCIAGVDGERLRWKFALYGTDRLMDAFGMQHQPKCEMIKHLSNAFIDEFSKGDNKFKAGLTKALNAKYRSQRSEIEDTLGGSSDEHTELRMIFDERTNLIMALGSVSKLTKIHLDQLVPSYLHMFLNRLFLVNARRQEMVVYSMLDHYYNMKTAKLKRDDSTERTPILID